MRRPEWALAAALGLLGAAAVQAQYGDSLRGATILRERGCMECHAVLSRGGGVAADLTSDSFDAFSPASFTAELWNHAPEMWSAMAAREGGPAPMSAQDMRDVFSFVWSVRNFEPSGNAGRGSRVFTEKQCHRCHALVRVEAGGIGPAVPDWPLTEPVRLLEAMWNHGAQMEEETRIDTAPWPTLTEREVADLIAYVNSLPDRPPRMGRLAMGSANAGMRLFDDLGCIRCHTIADAEPDLVPLGPATGRAHSLTELAAAMWNHQPVMREWAQETGMEIPRLESGQMGQLLSYLMEEGLLERTGNEKRGARVFEARGCAGCHEGAGVALARREWSPAAMAAAVWSHGRKMRAAMEEKGSRWPVLSAADVEDIVAWLNARQ